MPKNRRYDPHKFVNAYASGQCIHCRQVKSHWVHRGLLYRFFHRPPRWF